MEIYKAEICIGGLLTNTVIKDELTAAEILILRQVHGDDAVRGITPRGNRQIEYQKEYDRLLRKFGKRKLEAAFPGARPVLPQKLADVGIILQSDGYINDTVVAKGPNAGHNKGKAKTKMEKEIDDLGIESDDDEEKDEAA
jgi:hypothetical protein